ncbi:endopeptidase [Virgibacillus massiliensis]|nr:endopeptidase [Virgibacillus massiliensis]
MHDALKKMAKTAVKTVANLSTLKAKLIVFGVVALLFILFVFIVGVVQSIIGNDGNSGQEGEYVTLPPGTGQLNELVEGYRDEVEFYAKRHGVETHVDVLLAMMMQESGGFGNDPFQASESKCGVIGCITDPRESIDQGVKYYSQVLESANGDIKLTLQSYNFGGGFIDYVLKNGGSYTKDLAIDFSIMKYDELSHTGIYSCVHPEMIPLGACYGDVNYVDNVLRYYHSKSAEVIEGIQPDIAEGTEGQLKEILDEMYKYDGSEYVFGGDSPSTGFDCSGLMQWAFNKAGINLPRTAQQQYDATTKVTEDELQEGDLVFFTGTYNAGVPVTHVGIYIGDNKMYNSNSSGVVVTDLGDSYWASHIYGYGRVAQF